MQLTDKASEAFKAVILEAISTAHVYTGRGNDNKVLPCVICSSSGDGEEDPPMSGNYFQTVTVTVKTAPITEDTDEAAKLESQSFIESVFNALAVDYLATKLSQAVENFTVFPSGVFPSSPDFRADTEVWEDSQTFKIYCCNSNLN